MTEVMIIPNARLIEAADLLLRLSGAVQAIAPLTPERDPLLAAPSLTIRAAADRAVVVAAELRQIADRKE